MRAVQVLTEQQTESVVLSWQRNLVVLPDNENYFNEKFPGKGTSTVIPHVPSTPANAGTMQTRRNLVVLLTDDLPITYLLLGSCLLYSGQARSSHIYPLQKGTRRAVLSLSMRMPFQRTSTTSIPKKSCSPTH